MLEVKLERNDGRLKQVTREEKQDGCGKRRMTPTLMPRP